MQYRLPQKQIYP